jgi:Kef-type K+ transport system membrane component KefB
MVVAETKEQHPIEEEVAPLYAFFPPFFFAFIGTEIDLSVFAGADTLGLLVAITAVAVASKFAGAWLGARPLGGRDAAFVGVGMVPRGEVGIIVAGIGRTLDVIDGELFAVIVAMSVLTTVLVPPLLRGLVRGHPAPAVPESSAGR